MIKKYIDATVEADGDGYAEYDFTYELDYNTTDLTQNDNPSTETLAFSSSTWDDFVWDSFIWDGVTTGPKTIKLRGAAVNLSLIMRSNSDYFASIKFSGAILRYVNRRQKRS